MGLGVLDYAHTMPLWVVILCAGSGILGILATMGYAYLLLTFWSHD